MVPAGIVMFFCGSKLLLIEFHLSSCMIIHVMVDQIGRCKSLICIVMSFHSSSAVRVLALLMFIHHGCNIGAGTSLFFIFAIVSSMAYNLSCNSIFSDQSGKLLILSMRD
jgi:hypothetical protein